MQQLLPVRTTGANKMSFALYIVGYVILIIGLALGAYYLHVPPHWVAVGVLVMVGIGIASGVARTRQKDPS
jgi:predicted signal transduction protein with EAL and GGDEF domain